MNSEAPQPEAHLDKTARDLQWDQLMSKIAAYAASEAAHDRLRALRPTKSLEAAAQAQLRIREALALLRRDSPLPVSAVKDQSELCANLLRASAGTATQLHEAAKVIEQAARLRDHGKHHAASCPELCKVLWCAPELEGLRDRILRAVDEHGEVLDSASPGVRNARKSLAKHRERLRQTSQKLLTKFKDSLSGQFVAERGGRFVLPVRADAPHAVPGMILGSSSSGNSLYVEPAELTEFNNKVYVAEAELRREETIVLTELSQHATGLLDPLRNAYETCVEADCIAAITRWADASNAIPVNFDKSRKLVLRQMRHPLLIGEGQSVVPNDLQLQSGRCLVVSGPNAGGKTVALKCLGLAVWLAQSGLPITFDEQSEIGWFDCVYTDIGDEQSISRSLSTFSAHITRLSSYLACASFGSLILLDEIAGGTDPEEGSALAASVLEGFCERGAAVATTTHYERLKQLGADESGPFENASVGFDLQGMRPTFEVTMGIPGQSSALAVAERYGIPQELVERARSALPKEQVEQQKLLELLEGERQQLHEMRVKTQEELDAQQKLSQKMERETERAREQEHQRLRKEARALTLEVLEARALVRQAKEALRDTPRGSSAVRQAEQLVSDAASPVTLEGTLTKALTPEQGPAIDEKQLQVGAQVRIEHLGANGEVIAAPKKGVVRVNVGGLKLSVPVAKLRAPGAAPKAKTPAKSRPKRAQASPATQEAASSFSPSRTSGNTCDLRGLRVEQGLEQIDGFIDRMLQSDEPAAFFLHGHGTGAMKDAVREYVATSPHVSRWEPAQPEDGGDALTVCFL